MACLRGDTHGCVRTYQLSVSDLALAAPENPG